MSALNDIMRNGRTLDAHRPWPRVVVNAEIWRGIGAQFREGFHDYTIKGGGLEVYPRLVASEHSSHSAPMQITSGIPELDQLFGGGIDSGTSTLLMGPAGCGKSTIKFKSSSSLPMTGTVFSIFLPAESRFAEVDSAEEFSQMKIRA